tara:strand:+ start:1908 stop:2231 length:324 start_codon:yes stop_codon:yes gene_type:complete
MLKILKKEKKGNTVEVTIELPAMNRKGDPSYKSKPHEVEGFLRENVENLIEIKNLGPMGNYRENMRVKTFTCIVSSPAPATSSKKSAEKPVKKPTRKPRKKSTKEDV